MATVKADDIVNLAKSYVGYLEKANNSNLNIPTANAGSNNWTRFGRDYDTYMSSSLNGQAWCAMFVSCMGIYLGVGDSDYYKFAYCPYGVTWYKNKGWFHTSPKAGDIIFFKDSSGVSCHTGIVAKVSGGYVYTIEGNTSSAYGVIENGGAVAEKSYGLTYSRIMGYGRPNYGAESMAQDSNGCPYGTSTLTVKNGSTGAHVMRCQWYLNKANKAGLDIDGECGSKTMSAIKVFQSIKGLDVDGICGANTWAALESAVAVMTNTNSNTEVEDMTEAQTRVIAKEIADAQIKAHFSELEGKSVSGYAKGHWSEAKANGVTDGVAPQAYATREQVITFLGRLGILGLNGSRDVSDWARQIWGDMVDEGIFDGTAPGAAITREQTAAVLKRLADKLDTVN